MWEVDHLKLVSGIARPFRGEFRAPRKSTFRDWVEALLTQVGLGGLGDRYPWQLSGGMLQRTSLCRALIHEPELLAFVGAVISETVASNLDIGNLTMMASSNFDVPLVFAGLLILAILGVALYGFFSLVELRITG